jgi:WD40 repeat protein
MALLATAETKHHPKPKGPAKAVENDIVCHLLHFDLNSGKVTKTSAIGDELVVLVALSDDEKIASGLSLRNGKSKVRRWDINTGKEMAVGPTEPFRHSVSADSKRFAAANADSISFLNGETSKVINTLNVEKNASERSVQGVVIGSDSKTVLSLWTKQIHAIDDPSPSRLIAWDGEANKILWSHPVSYRGRAPMVVTGDKLLVGGGPNLFEVWSIKDGKKLESWGGHVGPVNRVASLGKGKILSAGADGQLLTWEKGKVIKRVDAHAGGINALVHDGHNDWLTAGADNVIKHWDLQLDTPSLIYGSHTGPVTSLAVAPKSPLMVSGSADRSVRTWNLTKGGKVVAAFDGHTDAVNAVAISADQKWIISGSDDATIRLWPVKLDKPDPDRDVVVLDDHKKPVTCLAISPDGKSLVSGSQDQTMIVWDLQTQKAKRTIKGHKNWVTSLMFVDAKTVLTTSDDLSLCMWNIETGKEMGRVDFGSVGDCPRCIAKGEGDRILVGSANWLIYEFSFSR